MRHREDEVEDRPDYSIVSSDPHREAAERGDVMAQFKLWICYMNGKGVEVDHAATEKLLRRAAAQRFSSAELVVMVMYSSDALWN